MKFVVVFNDFEASSKHLGRKYGGGRESAGRGEGGGGEGAGRWKKSYLN